MKVDHLVLTERESLFEERAAKGTRWLDDAMAQDADCGGTGEAEAGDFLPSILAEVQELADRDLAAVNAQMRREDGELRRQIVAREIAHKV